MIEKAKRRIVDVMETKLFSTSVVLLHVKNNDGVR